MTRPDVDDLAAPLDAVLIDAAFGPLRQLAPDMSTAKLAGRVAARPGPTVARLRSLAAELSRVGLGTSEIAPEERDRRFAEPAWTANPLLRRVLQSYLAACRTAEDLITDAGLGWRDDQRVRFLADNLLAALSPSNVPLLNPASAKAAIDTAGLNFVRGALNLVVDIARAPRVPQTVDRSGFTTGENLAATPGAVVLRTELFELIQYAPQTPSVRRVPLLLVPPTINKFYVLDLAPDRSWIEYLVRSGQQVFAMSWRNPDARHAGWGVDAYVQAVLDAMDAVERISAADRTVLTGVCSGGILAGLAAAHLARIGRLDRLAGLTFAVTVLDQHRAGLPAAIADKYLAAAATAVSRRRGYLDGKVLAEVFAWLRPDDLVWHYWVNNYLLGRKPPAFDVLYWNADTTRMPAQLHADLVDIALNNRLAEPGRAVALGAPVDLNAIDVDSYVIAGIADHITPWQSCYRTTGLLGGKTRFVLSSSGHIAALVNPPGNPKAAYRTSAQHPADPQEWLRGAVAEPGSWWPDFAGWLDERCGPDRRAPRKLGGRGFAPLIEAPGTYVLDH
ncbi:MAG TPA: alpha/beta fold hydrolase [Actinoplanes sp.]|nr:alpha/beta fold hydrolase [Actinoplanes sp.]